MKVLNIILIICGLLLFFIGIETEAPTTSATQDFSHLSEQLNNNLIDLRPNIKKVIDQLYPM